MTEVKDEGDWELESFNDQRTTAETSLREELNGEMSNALEKQADLLGSSLEEMESSISQLRDDMVGRLDDESGVLIATKEELTNLVGGERKEREAETAEIRAELATQLAASMTETSEGVKDDLARAIEDVRASGVAASESLNERVEQLGHDVAEMKAKQDGEPSVPSVTKEELEAVRASGVAASESLNERVEQMGHDVAEMKAKQDGEPSVPSVTKEELEALVGDERKEREAGTAELRAELATQLAAGIEEVRSSGVAASESLNERVEQMGHDVAEVKSVPSVTKEELEALVGDERKEREAGTAELRAELATQLAAGVEEVRANVVAASESLNERVEQLNDAVRKEETDRKVSVESLKGFVQGFVAANSPRPVAAQGGE
ncbi:hypothetical protein PPROV_000796400 [Pycnococcus provasolii]|uniref:Uncharacterized protein n=1 Tax=Pycnococcus provasolii TaxID=41880 RepID=A0A830HWE3_9CHLO|nr:hypothetical protein PPROV_000796400 [Pycnococcus provasolii]